MSKSSDICKSMRIVITGSESTGKTALTIALSTEYKGIMIPEYAREYLHRLNSRYSIKDVQKIADIQYREAKKIETQKLIFEDTDLLTTIIWLELKYNIIDQEQIARWQSFKPDLFIYCNPDIEWTFDPLRENPFDRTTISRLYLKFLHDNKVNYRIISGKGRQRLNQSRFYVDELMNERKFAS